MVFGSRIHIWSSPVSCRCCWVTQHSQKAQPPFANAPIQTLRPTLFHYHRAVVLIWRSRGCWVAMTARRRNFCSRWCTWANVGISSVQHCHAIGLLDILGGSLAKQLLVGDMRHSCVHRRTAGKCRSSDILSICYYHGKAPSQARGSHSNKALRRINCMFRKDLSTCLGRVKACAIHDLIAHPIKALMPSGFFYGVGYIVQLL